MSTRSMSEPGALHLRRGATTMRVAGPIGLPVLAVLCGFAVSKPAEATQKLCGDRAQILASLQQAHEETPQALGLSVDGGVIEVLVSPEGGWTMLVTYPKRPTCVVAAGEAWQVLQVAGEPA